MKMMNNFCGIMSKSAIPKARQHILVSLGVLLQIKLKVMKAKSFQGLGMYLNSKVSA
jgi:hypothetical protein